MGVKGLDSVVGRLKLHLDQTKGERTEAAISEMLIEGGINAHSLTPVDKTNLINSQGRQTWMHTTGWAGSLFYGAYYAGWVNKASGKLKGKPRPDGKGSYWAPDAEPHFL